MTTTLEAFARDTDELVPVCRYCGDVAQIVTGWCLNCAMVATDDDPPVRDICDACGADRLLVSVGNMFYVCVDADACVRQQHTNEDDRFGIL